MCGVVIKSLGVPSVNDGTPKRVVCLSGIAWPAMSLVSVEEIDSLTFLICVVVMLRLLVLVFSVTFT